MHQPPLVNSSCLFLTSVVATARFASLTYLVENAGAIVVTANLTSDGFEQNYAGNYLGHWLLLELLLPSLRASATPARITATSSISHWTHSSPVGDLLPETDGGRARTALPMAELVTQYGNTKLLQVAHLFEMQRRFQAEESPIACVPTAPGLISTRMGRQGRNHGESAAPAGSSALFSSFVGAAASLFMGMGRTPAHGAETTLHALLAREMGGRSADGYFLQPYYSPRHQQHPLLGGWGGVAQFELVRCSFLCLLLCSFVYSSLFSSLYLVQIGQRLTWGPHLWIAHPDAYNRSFGKELWTQSERAVRLEAK